MRVKGAMLGNQLRPVSPSFSQELAPSARLSMSRPLAQRSSESTPLDSYFLADKRRRQSATTYESDFSVGDEGRGRRRPGHSSPKWGRHLAPLRDST
jgi:hypothetical protein